MRPEAGPAGGANPGTGKGERQFHGLLKYSASLPDPQALALHHLACAGAALAGRPGYDMVLAAMTVMVAEVRS